MWKERPIKMTAGIWFLLADETRRRKICHRLLSFFFIIVFHITISVRMVRGPSRSQSLTTSRKPGFKPARLLDTAKWRMRFWISAAPRVKAEVFDAAPLHMDEY